MGFEDGHHCIRRHDCVRALAQLQRLPNRQLLMPMLAYFSRLQDDPCTVGPQLLALLGFDRSAFVHEVSASHGDSLIKPTTMRLRPREISLEAIINFSLFLILPL